MAVEAIVFDLDGVLVDSEQVWDAARRELVEDAGGTWRDEATRAMLGMSSPEWSRYVRDELGVDRSPEEINRAVVERLLGIYREELPLLPGAHEAIERLGGAWPLGLASSSNREVIDAVLEAMGVTARFRATASSEEVERGKPSPDVFLEAAHRLGVDPRACAAIEDSDNGIRSAHAAGMRVVAVPNAHFAPGEEALALADVVVDDLDAVTVEVVRG